MKIKTIAQIHTRLYESKQFDKINMGGHIRDQVADLSKIYGQVRSRDHLHRGQRRFLSRGRPGNSLCTGGKRGPVECVQTCLQGARGAETCRSRRGRNGEGSGLHRIQDDGIGIPHDVDINRATSLGLKLIRSLVIQLPGDPGDREHDGSPGERGYPVPGREDDDDVEDSCG